MHVVIPKAPTRSTSASWDWGLGMGLFMGSWAGPLKPDGWEEEGGRCLWGRVVIRGHLPTPHHSCRANAEIAQVRGKAQQEQAAYQASLRKEQLRVDALERTLEQKVTGQGWLPPSGSVNGSGPPAPSAALGTEPA